VKHIIGPSPSILPPPKSFAHTHTHKSLIPCSTGALLLYVHYDDVETLTLFYELRSSFDRLRLCNIVRVEDPRWSFELSSAETFNAVQKKACSRCSYSDVYDRRPFFYMDD
jgi:hypothetical protein